MIKIIPGNILIVLIKKNYYYIQIRIQIYFRSNSIFNGT